MALAALVAISGPKKVSISGPTPYNSPRNGYYPPQNHYVPRHNNNRFINSYIKNIVEGVLRRTVHEPQKSEPVTRELINFEDTKTKCRHLKKLTSKGTLRQVVITVYRLEIQSVLLVFSTQLFVNWCPSYLLSGLPPPYPPFLCQSIKVQYI